MTRKDFYVYRLIDPRTGEPFYIGKGKGKRCYAHERNWRNGKEPNLAKGLRFDEISASGKKVIVEKVFINLTEADAYALEKEEISKYPPGCLTNITSGGDGSMSAAERLLRWVKPKDQVDEELHQIYDMIMDELLYVYEKGREATCLKVRMERDALKSSGHNKSSFAESIYQLCLLTGLKPQ